jgi:hypothetical protein
MVKVLAVSVLLCFQLMLAGQPLFIYVKKGSVSLSNKTQQAGSLSKINPTDLIAIAPNALVLLKKNATILELTPDRRYSYSELDKLMRAQKSFSGAFADVLLNQDYSNRPEAGSSTRGSESADMWSFSPADSIRVLSDSVLLSVGITSSVLMTEISVYRNGQSDTLQLSRRSNFHTVSTPEPGVYYWGYKLRNGVSSNRFLNVFVVPESMERKNLLAAYQAYLDSIRGFSIPMQAQLITEYEYQKKVYVKK